MSDRIPDGYKMLIYERFFRPNLRYTIEEAYAFIEAEAPNDWARPEAKEEFQAKVLATFPPMEPGEL